MKRKFFLAILVCLQILCISMQVFAMDSPTTLNKSEHHARSREQRLSSSMKQIFGVDIEINGDNLVFRGTQSALDLAFVKLSDFNELRRNVMPVSSEAILTQACANSQFSSWNDCLTSLGIHQNNLSNFAITNQLDEVNCLKIPYGKESGKLTFNQKLAKLYVEEIKNLSPYFNWISRCNTQIIETVNEYLVINYGLLTEHFCSLKINKEPTKDDSIFASHLSLTAVLKKLTAAAGGDISLVGTSTPGQYQVRTVMLGSNSQQSVGVSTPIIEIVIDRSGSMDGENIDIVNKRIPMFLKELRSALTEGQSLKVEVFAFSNDIAPYQTYTLSYDSIDSPIVWQNITATGGTDLTKVGERLKLSSPDERKVVVAFTDGEHASNSDLNASLSSLSTLQHDGCFAQPYFCRVGVASDNNTSYFSKISKTFAGSFYDHANIEDFCKEVSSNIPYLLESNIPLILTLDGIDVTIRQQDAKPDVHTTTQTVSAGDSIMHRGIRSTVDVRSEIERLEAQLAALKTGEKK